MAINNQHRGFTLLIAVIFMTVMLSFGLALGSLGYKQITLASTATQSQYAFYAADAGLECALYADQQSNPLLFTMPASDPVAAGIPVPAITCNGDSSPYASSQIWNIGQPWIIKETLDVDTNRCAEVSIYKYTNPITVNTGNGTILVATYIFSQGYDVACSAVGASTRAVSRGQYIYY
jgi:Tfp pilus assembly protein PilX